MKKLLIHTASALALIGAASGAAWAADGYTGIHPTMTAGLSIAAGAFFSKTDNEYRLKSGGESGTKVDTDDLGIDDTKTVPFGTLRWRFTDRWRVEGNYFSVDTDGKVRTSEQIDWGDLDFEVGAELKTKAKTKIARAAVGYSFIKRDQVELGAGVGVHYLDWEATLKGDATIKLSLSHAADRVEPCVRLTPEQIAELAPRIWQYSVVTPLTNDGWCRGVSIGSRQKSAT